MLPSLGLAPIPVSPGSPPSPWPGCHQHVLLGSSAGPETCLCLFQTSWRPHVGLVLPLGKAFPRGEKKPSAPLSGFAHPLLQFLWLPGVLQGSPSLSWSLGCPCPASPGGAAWWVMGWDEELCFPQHPPARGGEAVLPLHLCRALTSSGGEEHRVAHSALHHSWASRDLCGGKRENSINLAQRGWDRGGIRMPKPGERLNLFP